MGVANQVLPKPPKKNGLKPMMRPRDVERVLVLLDQWQRGEIHVRLSWEALAKASGWDRKTLAKKDNLRARFSEVRAALLLKKHSAPKSRRIADPIEHVLRQELKMAHAEIEELRSVIAAYDRELSGMRRLMDLHNLAGKPMARKKRR